MSQRGTRGMWVWIAPLIFGLAGSGCIESNPQPSPEHGWDAQVGVEDTATNPSDKMEAESARMALSAPGSESEVMGVGREGAAEGALKGTAYPTGKEDQTGVEFGVGEKGQFAFITAAEANAEVLLVFEYETGEEEEVSLLVPERDSTDRMAPWLLDFSSGFSDPTEGSPSGEDGDWYNDAAGGAPGITIVLEQVETVVVEGSQFATTPLSMVSVMNVQTGESVVVQADASGAFVAELKGQSGDQIALFVYNSESPEKASSPWFGTVPE